MKIGFQSVPYNTKKEYQTVTNWVITRVLKRLLCKQEFAAPVLTGTSYLFSISFLLLYQQLKAPDSLKSNSFFSESHSILIIIIIIIIIIISEHGKWAVYGFKIM